MRLPSLTDAAAWTTVLAAAASAQNSSFAQECSALSSALSSVVPNATVWFSEFVTGGTNITFPDNDAR